MHRLFWQRRDSSVATDETIEFLTSETLPRPLRDLVEFAQLRPDYNVGNPEVAEEWAAEIGARRAEIALCQIIQILACPPEIVWGFNVGFVCDNPYGFVEFYAGWQSALALTLGVPDLLVPTAAEWCNHWEPHRKQLELVQRSRPKNIN
jgi:hypothetical protein